MALITISGVALPTPTEFSIGYQMLSKAERNANGRMIIEKVADKTKLFITYAYITQSDATKVLNLVSPASFSVTYFDAKTNSTKSGQFYCGDRQLGMIDFYDGITQFKDFSFNIIEI